MPAWGDSRVWRVLDTDFGDGSQFLAHWAAWGPQTHPPRRLHYVAIAACPPNAAALLQKLQAHNSLVVHGAELMRHWQGLEAGFHRLELSAGRVLLTICVGPLPNMLREQQFMADSVLLAAPMGAAEHAVWDRWSLKALMRLCRRGTRFQVSPAPQPALLDALGVAGVVMDAAATGHTHRGCFDPPWEPGHSRHQWRSASTPTTHCAIVGAGLAGATAAAALARRGWQVTVLDAAAAPASGASGLPAALMVPQLSSDNNSRSRLSRSGVGLTRQWCHELLLEGEDWAPSGARQMFPGDPRNGTTWHAHAAWIKPARLVQACLARTGVQFVGSARVDRVVWQQDGWVLLDAAGLVLAQAPQLVLANANGVLTLLPLILGANGQPLAGLQQPKAMQAVGGQISWGLHTQQDAAHFPEQPVNGRGHFMANIPMDGSSAWFLGATYETGSSPRVDEATSHQENWCRLAQLSPAAARTLAQRFKAGQVRSWHGTRCTTTDRLPAVGAMQRGTAPSLWMTAGMGSRGLTYAVLGAELLAAQMGGEPLPVEASLARLLAATHPGQLHHL